MLNKKELFCRITSQSSSSFLVFSRWKVVYRCFEAPCEVWCKFTFSSVSFSHLFVYYPGRYVTTYKFWCCRYTLINITSESKHQSVISDCKDLKLALKHRHHSKCLRKLKISRFEHNLELVCNLNGSKLFYILQNVSQCYIIATLGLGELIIMVNL